MWILSSPAVDFFSPRGLTSLWALATSSNCFRGKAKIALAISSACTGWVPMIYQIGFSLKFEEIPQKLSFKWWSIICLNYKLDNKIEVCSGTCGRFKNLSQNQLGIFGIEKVENSSRIKRFPFQKLTLQSFNRFDRLRPQIQKPLHHRPLSVLHTHPRCSPQRSR